LIILTACLGKFGGSTLAARWVGLGWREAAAIGILMNTRGLMELIVLNVGLDLGILSPKLFTMMVLMALVTTWITSPLLEWFYPRHEMFEKPLPPDEPVVPAPVLLCVSDPALVPALLAVGRCLIRPDESLLALHVVKSDRPSAYLGAPQSADSEPLTLLQTQAAQMGISVRPLSFVAADPAKDIVRFAEAKAAGMVVLGSHRPVVGADILAGVVGRVIAEATTDVVVLMDHGLQAVKGMYVMGDNPAIQALTARLGAAGVQAHSALGPGILVVAALGSDIPEGVSALLVQARRA
jgi:nucleotide-binding universal stress UspA family protein